MSAAAIPPGVVADAVGAARAFLRIEGAGEQALLERLAATAILLGEAFTGTLFVVRTVEEMVEGAGGGWRLLAVVPVRAISGETGVTGDIDGDGRGWVRVARGERVAVGYTAGLAETWDMLPAPLAQGVVALIAHLFDDRTGTTQPPASVAALWRPYRRMQLARAEHAA